MAYQSLDLGTSADDGTGDSLRVGGDKINDNFSEIYTLLGTGTALTSGLSATATVVTLSSAVGTFTTLTPAAADGTALGSASLEWSDLFLADGAVINLGSDQDVTLTHVADTGILLNSTRQLQFGDSGTYIHQSADGVLDLVSDTELELNATTIDINGAVDISGATTVGGILKTDDTTEATSTTDGSLQTDGGLSVAKDVVAGDDVKLLSDAAVLAFGADGDVTLTHVADTGLLLNGTSQLQFNDASQNITAPSGTVLDINATDEVELNATLVDVNANLDVSGTYTGGGLMTTGGNIVIPDAGTIGSASATSAMTVASTGIVTFVDDIIIKDGGTIGAASATGAITISSGGIVTLVDDLIIKDGGTIGSASDVDAIAIGSDGDVTLTQDLELQHDGAILSFGANDEITLTHVHDTGLLLADSGGTPTLQFHDSNESVSSDGGHLIFTSNGVAFDFPSADGSSGQVIKTNGSGVLSFTDVTASSLAADDLAAGDAAVTLTTSSGNITIDAAANDSDIIFKGTDGSADTTFLTIDGSDAGTAIFNHDIKIADDGQIGSASAADAMIISSGGIVTFKDDIKIKDGGTIGSASDPDAISIASGGGVTLTQALAGTSADFDGGVTIDNITIDGTEIDLSSGDLTIDVAGDLVLDAGGGDFKFGVGGTEILRITNSSSDVIIKPTVDTKDIIFQQFDGTEVARVEDNGTFNVATAKLAINGTAITSTAAELNYSDGVTSAIQTQIDAKASTGKAIAMAIVFG